MNCPNCDMEDIEVQVQLSIVAKLDEFLKGKLTTIVPDDIDYMWCHSCSQGIKLLEDGRLITYLEYTGKTTKVPKSINKNDLIKLLRRMNPDKIDKLIRKEE